MTTSTGMFGLADNLGYATAKAAVVGMTRSLSVAGAAHGIAVNLIAPNAWTRMAGRPSKGLGPDKQPAPKQMEPELVAPMVAFLAHEACDVSGDIYVAGGGRFARMFIAVTEGYVASRPEQSTIEDVAANWAAINDETGYYVPADLLDWSAHYMATGRHRGSRTSRGIAVGRDRHFSAIGVIGEPTEPVTLRPGGTEEEFPDPVLLRSRPPAPRG